MASPLLRDGRGYEAQFSTNHLGHFQLTARLWPALVKANGARVICVSSLGHFFSDISDDWNFETREYDRWKSYGQSKTANILFALALDTRGSKFGVRAFSLHPGSIVTTELARWFSREDNRTRWTKSGFLDEEGNPRIDPVKQRKSAQQGASTTVWGATSPLLEGKGGLYLENNNISPRNAELGGTVGLTFEADSRGFYGVKDYAIDPASADKLWILSERLTGVTFTI
jgi:NAD(P)-dependent dehydrogenase (short-subunit alcohol dehydrogenase family)